MKHNLPMEIIQLLHTSRLRSTSILHVNPKQGGKSGLLYFLYFLVLLCTSGYFLVLLGTSLYFLYFFVLLRTSLYFSVLLRTFRTSWYFNNILIFSLLHHINASVMEFIFNSYSAPQLISRLDIFFVFINIRLVQA